MNVLDFLSLSPSLYLLKQKRGKNKLGGFFSLIFVLIMIALTVYYLYIYFFSLDYNLIYYRDNRDTYMNEEQIEIMKKPKPFIFAITDNPNNAKITPYLKDYYNNLIPAEKCSVNFTFGEAYCFDLVFYSQNREIKKGNHSLLVICEENCTDSDGKPVSLELGMATQNLKIEHSNENPLQYDGYTGYKIPLTIQKNISEQHMFNFIPILYDSSEILNTKRKIFIGSYLTSDDETTTNRKDDVFAVFYININNECDIYIRDYKTLLDTLSKIGGLFTPFKFLFEILIIFYSDLENNSEITKNVFSKIKNYEYKPNINIPISIEKNNNIDIKVSNENKNIRKKFRVKKGEQYFCSFFNFCCNCCYFCKTHRTMKILNLCSDFVHTYLSAENIIFNMILFESYYQDNPIKLNENTYLKKIYKEIENEKIIEKEESDDIEKNEEEKKEENASLIPLNSEE